MPDSCISFIIFLKNFIVDISTAFLGIDFEGKMALRGVWQLQKLIVSYSDWGGSSRGIRYMLSLSLSIITLHVCLINQNLDIGSLVYYRKVRKIIAVGMGYRLTLLLNRGIFFFLVNLFAKPKQESSIASWVPICFDITYVTHKISSACVIFDWWTNSRYYWRFCNWVSILMELASWHPSHLILCVLTPIVIMLYINNCLKDK